MRTLVAIGILPPAILGVVGLLQPTLVLGQEDLNASLVWSLIGVLISYFGLVISSFALFEVTRLTNRYFARQRLPEIQKQLKKIADTMSGKADIALKEMRSERFIGETAVMLRQIKLVKFSNASISSVIKKAEASHTALGLEMKRPESGSIIANESNQFWDLFQSLSELADEIEEYKKGVQATL
jgi:hypothetical protein